MDSVFRALPLPQKFPGRLWLTEMPGRYHPWKTTADFLRNEQIDRIVCLVDNEEIQRKSPSYWKVLQKKTCPVPVVKFPIIDFSAPGPGFSEFVDECVVDLGDGKRLLAHCAAGIGRTGTFAVAVLLKMGVPIEAALASVEEVGSDPETQEQRDILNCYG